MTQADPEAVKKVRRLLSLAVNGQLSLEELNERWPHEGDQDPFLSAVFEDLEEGVEHFPGHWWTREPDFEAWLNSGEYVQLYIDSKLLDLPEPSSTLASWRAAAWKHQFITLRDADQFIDSVTLRRE